MDGMNSSGELRTLDPSGLEHFVPAGLDLPRAAIGLSGLRPLAVLRLPPVVLRRAPGVVRAWIDFPTGYELNSDSPITYRLRGHEAGLELQRESEIVLLNGAHLPIEFPYAPRKHPDPPAGGDLTVELSFNYCTLAAVRVPQDLQWRQPIQWARSGTNEVDLHYVLTV